MKGRQKNHFGTSIHGWFCVCGCTRPSRVEKTGNDPCPTERKGSPAPLAVEAAMWAVGRLFKMLRGGKRDRDFTWETILFSKERNAFIFSILGNRREVAFFWKATALGSILKESDSSLSRPEKGNKRNEKRVLLGNELVGLINPPLLWF